MYAVLLDSDEVWEGTVQELADRFKVDLKTMTGFLDGINDSLKATEPDRRRWKRIQKVSLAYDKELLYKNMVEATADWLYKLPVSGTDILTAETQEGTLSRSRSLLAPPFAAQPRRLAGTIPVPAEAARSTSICCGR